MEKSEAQVEVKVRLISDSSVRGVIVAKVSRKNKNNVIVEWQDGECSPINPDDLEIVPVSDGKLEKEFEDLVASIGLEIQDKVAQAEKLLNEACALADEHGIPFFTNVSLLGQPYVPEKFQTKWSDLDRDYIADLTEVMPSDLGTPCGWQTSEVC